MREMRGDDTMKIKPCPFCGTDDIRIGESTFKCIYCPTCGVRGPTTNTKTNAIKYWNDMPRDDEEEQ